MPEIIEVDLVRGQLEAAAAGRVLTDLSCPKPLARRGSIVQANATALLTAGRLLSVGRHAKEMYLFFEDGSIVKSHLGMSGVWLALPTDTIEAELDLSSASSRFTARAHIRYLLHFSGGVSLVYFDARGFGQFSLAKKEEVDRLFAVPDILSASFSFDEAASVIWSSPRPIYHFLHDQEILPGMGAYLGAEFLFRCRIHPLTPGRNISLSHAVMLGHLRELLSDAREAQGASFSNYRQVSGEEGKAHLLFKVYGREGLPCLTCQTPVERLEKKRGSQFCPTCQPLG